MIAVIDGVAHDPQRPDSGGRRCMGGYWQPPEPNHPGQ